MVKKKKVSDPKVVSPPPPTLGRKRDPSLDISIMNAALEILAEEGFDGMTMDQIATKVGTGKAACYRRWPSKVKLVKDALIWMNRNQLELEKIPDTGSLRNDFLALLKPHSMEEANAKLRILGGLGTFWLDEEIETKGITEIFGPWMEVNRTLMQRAMERGEISKKANVELVCKVMNSMATYRALIERKPPDKSLFIALIDQVVMPALKYPG
ncbi:TetR family transcriptional regulator [Leptospira levettii]|uniref:TetR/AcrR family transcriptional regulator n=1 Tax=Leptospira levettii TaxID=2023178 RepID=UPI000C29F31F|nr:TetR/AcrR family transcriptional regulator [Leptospira levettii]PJZ88150.1 TetR family transcriptional regulator [Leptospira levettii]PKA02320.1 TetR family transcriptional regulator [Leptospira levettii]